MGEPIVSRESFAFWVVRQFLATEEDRLLDLQPITNKEFCSVFFILVLGIVILALTIGPFAPW